MQSRATKLFVRASLALRQNKLALAFVALWVAGNTLVFARLYELKLVPALLTAACIVKMPGGWTGAYQSFTEVVVFGVIASVVVTNVTRKYRPEETSRALARQSTGHVVVVGFSNLGKRVRELTLAAGKPVVVIEQNAEVVAALVREEEPVVLGSAADPGLFEAAAVASARVVVIATDDLEEAAIACRRVRELNASCELVVRSADDDVGAVLARTYRGRAISTSRLAAGFIQSQAVKLRARKVVVFGTNNLGLRAAEALAEKRIAVSHAAATSDPSAIAAAGVADADLVVLCDDDLGDNLIRVDRIRDVNKRTRIICRAFHEDAAEILARPPFECVLLSTSRHAAEALVRSGAFREMGIDEPETRTARALATAE